MIEDLQNHPIHGDTARQDRPALPRKDNAVQRQSPRTSLYTSDNTIVGHSTPTVENPFGNNWESTSFIPDTVSRELPIPLVKNIGLRTRKGNIKYDLAILSRVAELYERYKCKTEPIVYSQGFEVEQKEYEFIASLKSIIQSVYQRLFKRADLYITDNTIVGHSGFDTFYASRATDYRRRIKKSGHIIDLGCAVSEQHVRGKGCERFGKRLQVGAPLDRLSEATQDAPLPVVLSSIPEGVISLESGSVSVMRMIEREVAQEYQLFNSFTHSITRTALKGQTGRVAGYFDWQQRMSTRSEALKRRSLHIGVGAFRKAEARPATDEIKQHRAVTVPYFIAEIDGMDAESSFHYAHLLIERLNDFGVDLSSIVISFSGNRSFHIRIPMGMLDNPIFRNTVKAKEIISKFFELLTKGLQRPEGTLYQILDNGIFSPNRLIRAIGSVHEKTEMFTVAFRGTEFLETPLWMVKAYSDMYSPYTLSDPSEADVELLLVQLLQRAVEAIEKPLEASKGTGNIKESRGIIEAIRDGITEGETVHESVNGRNDAANRYALNLIQRYGSEKAMRLIEEWNQKNDPPLPQYELHSAFKSAEKYFQRTSDK